MISISEEISQRFTLMGFISAICVVFLHMGMPTLEGTSGWWFHEISQTLCWFSVPFFFLTSGFFLAGHIGEEGWYWREVLKRVRTILLPFLVWSFIFWFYLLAMGVAGDLLWHRPIGEHTSYLFSGKTLIDVIGLNVFHSPFYSVTWFLRALFFLVLLSPFIERLTRNPWMIFVFLFFELAYRLRPHVFGEFSGVLDSVFALRGLGWFALGMGLRLERIRMPRLEKWVSVPLLLIVIAFAILSIYVGYRSVFMFCATPFVIGFLGVITPSVKLPLIWSGCVFPLYLLHSIFISVFCLLVSSSTDCWLIAVARVIFAIVASIGLTIVLRKRFPGFCLVLFGR